MTIEEAISGISIAVDKYNEYEREWVEITEDDAKKAIEVLESVRIGEKKNWSGEDE